jgi:hypothetical protein
MAKQPESTTTQPTSSEHPQEEFTGVYGFFRRHQKKLLYSAGLFTLLTFSITGPMLQVVDELFGAQREMPSIEVLGTRIKLEPDDYRYGDQLARNALALPPVLPTLGFGEGGRNELADNLAILRRAAIAEGVDVSMVEVDRAIEELRVQSGLPSAARLAGQRGFGSLAEYRMAVREAMRIGTYVRLQTLALDCSDARVLERLTENREKITLRVASLDEEEIEKQLKAQGAVSDDDLRTWLDGQDEATKNRLKVYDFNHVDLRFGALLLGEGQFDPAEWQEGALKDFSTTDAGLRAEYEKEKERYKIEDKDEYKPFDEVRPDLERLLQAERVVQDLLGQLRNKQNDDLADVTQQARTAEGEVAAARAEISRLEAKAAEAPEDATVAEELRVARETLTQKLEASEAAKKALDQARTAWDMPSKFAELVEGKKGFVQKDPEGLRSAEELKDLDALGLDLGKWPASWEGCSVNRKGELSRKVWRTSKGVLLYQVTDLVERPLKGWDVLRPILEGAYYTEKAHEQAEEKKGVLEAALLRLAKARMPEKIAEIEGTRQAKIDERLVDWEKKTQEGIAEAERMLQPLVAGTRAHQAWQKKLDDLKAALAAKDTKGTEIEAAVDAELTAEIAEEAKKHYHEVLAEAASEAGFLVSEIGPYRRELKMMPRFEEGYDKPVVFMFSNYDELELHETTGIVNDDTNRRWYVGVCTSVEPLTRDDITRREFEGLRKMYYTYTFGTLQSLQAYDQAFTFEALEKRYKFERAVGEQQVMSAPDPAIKSTEPK